MDDGDSEVVGEDGQESVDHPHSSDGGQEDEPEVEEDVDLLIDDVEGKNTKGIMLLDRA